MEEKSEPKRALIVILSALLGGMLSILLVLIRHYAIKQQVA
jgi:LPS O-antigen subunit length determinant protein (WzzB/FepE family)